MNRPSIQSQFIAKLIDRQNSKRLKLQAQKNSPSLTPEVDVARLKTEHQSLMKKFKALFLFSMGVAFTFSTALYVVSGYANESQARTAMFVKYQSGMEIGNE